MSLYNIQYIHKIAPNKTDTEGPFEIRDGAFASKTKLAEALRKLGALTKGQRIWPFRVEGDKTIVFPTSGIWHALIIQPASAYEAHHKVIPGTITRVSPQAMYPGHGSFIDNLLDESARPKR